MAEERPGKHCTAWFNGRRNSRSIVFSETMNRSARCSVNLRYDPVCPVRISSIASTKSVPTSAWNQRNLATSSTSHPALARFCAIVQHWPWCRVHHDMMPESEDLHGQTAVENREVEGVGHPSSPPRRATSGITSHRLTAIPSVPPWLSSSSSSSRGLGLRDAIGSLQCDKKK